MDARVTVKQNGDFRRIYRRGRSAVAGGVVVYCLKNVSVLTTPFGLPELIAGVAIVLIHVWKRNTLLSIGGGTLFYMFLVQVIFK